ncbi:oligoketide cyclase/lipid transport protein [Bernardetia litoralis DSM 6794]|uniref:Oligoketide cyclase/lipid transport protein n=1 Tax=Bernardetia litoralis (strain ATCC 23117 / DSM 6794 / NBRC 15988 / NCIMB 1366 / Fx l1 / Sio-4) TaxID=880071 RepID=I4ANB9_BERLS|nr:SRPBCC family protein [Bernardetia litoralis]AFM05454.1 oligoketide cyclase/lipid transport protein [Bernardetia litoralis DSM 6794]
MNNLQKALSINAIFSGVSGTGFILFHKSMADLFAIEQNSIFWIVGIGLIFFALTIVLEVKKQRRIAILWIIIQDFIWVIASIILLLLQPFGISDAGNNIITIIALIVLVMAINQLRALVQTKNKKDKKRLVFNRIVQANKSDVWKVISDVANYHQVAPNVDNVAIISGKDEGMVRSCSHGKDSWTETCSIWQEEETYAFIVNTSAPNYPYPLSYLKGTWNITKIDSNQTKIEMIFEFTYKNQILDLMHPLMKMKSKQICDELLDNWQKMLEK